MRVRVMRDPDPTSSQARLTVQRWFGGQWDLVRSFELHEFDQAHEFAMKLSMSKRDPTELAAFDDGEKAEAVPAIVPLVIPAVKTGAKPSGSQS